MPTKKIKTPNEFWGSAAAGCMPLAQSTGRILLTLRSAEVQEPGTWGLPGGAIDPGENPVDTARREAEEELNYYGPMQMIAGFVFKKHSFRYHNFIGLVPDEFEPSLNWESTDAQWFDLERLPSPLHFGVRIFLSNSEKLIRQQIEKTHMKKEFLLRAFVRSIID